MDAVLGPLAEGQDELIGSLREGDRTVELRIRLEGAPAEEVLPAARELKQLIEANLRQARRELLSLLPTVNGGYREPGEGPLDAEEFLRRARLDLVEVGPEGDVRFTFADDDMLWGHWMTVTHQRGAWTCDFWG